MMMMMTIMIVMIIIMIMMMTIMIVMIVSIIMTAIMKHAYVREYTIEVKDKKINAGELRCSDIGITLKELHLQIHGI
jgi:hypothetical protein